MRLRDLFARATPRAGRPQPPDGRPAVRPAVRPAWPDLPPVQRVVSAPSLITAPDRFAARLASWADPSFLGVPGHLVSADAPSGSVAGLARPDGVLRWEPPVRWPAGSGATEAPAAGGVGDPPAVAQRSVLDAGPPRRLPAVPVPAPSADRGLGAAVSVPLPEPVWRPAIPATPATPVPVPAETAPVPAETAAVQAGDAVPAEVAPVVAPPVDDVAAETVPITGGPVPSASVRSAPLAVQAVADDRPAAAPAPRSPSPSPSPSLSPEPVPAPRRRPGLGAPVSGTAAPLGSRPVVSRRVDPRPPTPASHGTDPRTAPPVAALTGATSPVAALSTEALSPVVAHSTEAAGAVAGGPEPALARFGAPGPVAQREIVGRPTTRSATSTPGPAAVPDGTRPADPPDGHGAPSAADPGHPGEPGEPPEPETVSAVLGERPIAARLPEAGPAPVPASASASASAPPRGSPPRPLPGAAGPPGNGGPSVPAVRSDPPAAGLLGDVPLVLRSLGPLSPSPPAEAATETATETATEVWHPVAGRVPAMAATAAMAGRAATAPAQVQRSALLTPPPGGPAAAVRARPAASRPQRPAAVPEPEPEPGARVPEQPPALTVFRLADPEPAAAVALDVGGAVGAAVEGAVEAAGAPGTPAAPAPDGAPSGPPSAGAATSATAVDALVQRLFDPLVRQLKAELRLDRERTGSALDFRY